MTVSAFKFLQGIPAARPSAHQERTVHKTLLSAVAAAGLLVSAGHAAAQDSGSVDIVTNVTAYCQAVVNPSAPIELGELSNGDGFLDAGALSGDEAYTFPGFWCNSPVAVSLMAAPLENQDVASVADAGFTRVVNYTATLDWDDVNGSDDSANAAPTDFTTAEANKGDLILQVTDLDANNKRLAAGAYAGTISVSFTPN